MKTKQIKKHKERKKVSKIDMKDGQKERNECRQKDRQKVTRKERKQDRKEGKQEERKERKDLHASPKQDKVCHLFTKCLSRQKKDKLSGN